MRERVPARPDRSSRCCVCIALVIAPSTANRLFAVVDARSDERSDDAAAGSAEPPAASHGDGRATDGAAAAVAPASGAVAPPASAAVEPAAAAGACSCSRASSN